MAGAHSSLAIFLRHNHRGFRRNPSSRGHVRRLSVGGDGGGDRRGETRSLSEIAEEVCRITRTRPRWEATLASEFPSVDFSDPGFFRELFRRQRNAFLSLRFFRWAASRRGAPPDPASCALLFDALVAAKSPGAAKSVLGTPGFSPGADSLERYVRCASEGGLLEDAVDGFFRLGESGACPSSIETWNSVLKCCLEARRTDLVLEFYEEMVKLGVVRNANAETVGHLIRAFCEGGNLLRGYELLWQGIEGGLIPQYSTFIRLISGFCRQGDYAKVSQILHLMIAKDRAPDMFTYQEVINGLCKNGRQLEAYRIFNDLKDRGYFPDRVMYTTLIHGFCDIGQIGEARKLWFEMIRKGFVPNEHTYTSLIHGFFKSGKVEEAKKLFDEMCCKGHGESTAVYNMMISGLSIHGRLDEAVGMFEEMPQKGIARNQITYDTLVQGYCREGKITDSRDLLNELSLQGVVPSSSSYAALLEKLIELGELEGVKLVLSDTQNKGVKLLASTWDRIVNGLCKRGFVTEAMGCLVDMLNRNIQPRKTTFNVLIQNLLQGDSLDDCELVLDTMFRMGYVLEEGMCHSLVNKICKQNSNFGETCMAKILEGN
ncbi:hypothetical protein EUGRSUZ_C04132 [Eucalyptus grandis]|uniref:Uncharacterized protein n=2 Tax=Eucalyptus grandis TaxID=71139 RepID=A0ACC3LJP7_EUCGR|nr:hypothetical protein EUGRSUZ_C04132 [Eucalyptus grandis]